VQDRGQLQHTEKDKCEHVLKTIICFETSSVIKVNLYVLKPNEEPSVFISSVINLNSNYKVASVKLLILF
jgi:hypothetical protein